MYDYTNYYAKMTNKNKSIIREKEYVDMLIRLILPMVQFKGFPETVKVDNLSIYNLINGCYGVTEYNGQLVGLGANPSGLLDINGDAIKVKLFSMYNPTVLDRVNDKNCVVGYTNLLKTVDRTLFRYAHQFAQTDLSQVFNLKYARMNKIYKASTEQTKNALLTALKGADMGLDNVILSDNIFNDLIFKGTSGNEIESIDLTDVKQIDKMQYLSSYYWDLLRRFLWIYGISLNNQPKMAQVSTLEITNNGNGCSIIASEMLHCANVFCEKVNKLYGLDTFAEFGNAWEVSLNSMGMESDENGIVTISKPKEEKGVENDNKSNED